MGGASPGPPTSISLAVWPLRTLDEIKAKRDGDEVNANSAQVRVSVELGVRYRANTACGLFNAEKNQDQGYDWHSRHMARKSLMPRAIRDGYQQCCHAAPGASSTLRGIGGKKEGEVEAERDGGSKVGIAAGLLSVFDTRGPQGQIQCSPN